MKKLTLAQMVALLTAVDRSYMRHEQSDELQRAMDKLREGVSQMKEGQRRRQERKAS